MTALDPDSPLPALRTRLEAIPAEEQGAGVFLLRDLEELTDKSLALSGGGMLLVSFLDGRRTASEVRDLFEQAGGHEIDEATVLELVGALEKAGYLETPEIAARRAALQGEFKASPRRKTAFAGASYAAQPGMLSADLDRFFISDKGPAKPRAAHASRPSAVGLVAPHIDFTRGGHAYAWAYQALSERRPPDVVVALGTAHSSPDSPWIFSPKKYETPFGPMELDSQLYDDLASKVWYEPRADEWTHKNEHSLEFQAVWLRHLWGAQTPPWVPILVSSFERYTAEEPPSQTPTLEKALKDFCAVVKEHRRRGRNVLVLCGIDLAHVGPRFGDELEITPALEKKIETEDAVSLVQAMTLDADGFYRSVTVGGLWRKVCGLSALYTGLRLMRSLDAGHGRLLTYGQAPDPAGGVVSFASAVYDAS